MGADVEDGICFVAFVETTNAGVMMSRPRRVELRASIAKAIALDAIGPSKKMWRKIGIGGGQE